MLNTAFWLELDDSKGIKVFSSVSYLRFIAKLKIPMHPRIIHIMLQPNTGVIYMFINTPPSEDKPKATKNRELQVIPCLNYLDLDYLRWAVDQSRKRREQSEVTALAAPAEANIELVKPTNR